MSVTDSVAGRAGHALGVDAGRLKRMVGYGFVGLSGVAVDLGMVQALRGLGLHYLPTILLSYQLAMTWNFIWQRQLVFRATAGNAVRQYLRYFVVDISAFIVRAGVVVLTVDVTTPWDALPYVPTPLAPAVPASAVGIGLAFLVGFAGTDTLVFGEGVPA